MQDVAPYRITGLVDIRDEQNNITGQFPIGSVQTLPVEFGQTQVEAGLAERLDADEAVAPADVEDAAPVVDAEDDESSDDESEDEDEVVPPPAEDEVVD